MLNARETLRSYIMDSLVSYPRPADREAMNPSQHAAHTALVEIFAAMDRLAALGWPLVLVPPAGSQRQDVIDALARVTAERPIQEYPKWIDVGEGDEAHRVLIENAEQENHIKSGMHPDEARQKAPDAAMGPFPVSGPVTEMDHLHTMPLNDPRVAAGGVGVGDDGNAGDRGIGHTEFGVRRSDAEESADIRGLPRSVGRTGPSGAEIERKAGERPVNLASGTTVHDDDATNPAAKDAADKDKDSTAPKQPDAAAGSAEFPKSVYLRGDKNAASFIVQNKDEEARVLAGKMPGDVYEAKMPGKSAEQAEQEEARNPASPRRRK